MGDILVVTSKVKKYVKEKADMNTSATFIENLSATVEKICDAAIEAARNDRRKTVKDRDIPTCGGGEG